MHNTLRIIISTVCVLAIGALCRTSLSASPRLTLHPALASTDFAERWSWVEAEARRGSRGGWVGYAIDLWLEPDRYLFSGGSLSGEGSIGGRWHGRGEPLGEMLGNEAIAGTSGTSEAVNSPLAHDIRKTVAVLLRLAPNGQITEVDIIDLTMPADLHGLPLAWIGPASADESFGLVSDLFERPASERPRGDLVETVGLHDRPQAVDFLRRVLENEDNERVREEAAESLACQSDPRALALLIRTAHEDRSQRVREEAVETLGESRVPGAEAALIDLARRGEGPRLRAEAVETLADLATPDAWKVIHEILWDDPDIEVQEEALDALADRDQDDPLPMLIKVARHHPKIAIRQEAVEALAELAGDRVVGTLEDLVYRDTHAAIREEALDALAELAGGEGIAVLAKIASTHTDPRLREEALGALADASEDHSRARRALEMMSSY